MIPDIHKTVIVAGASQGIGAGLLKALDFRDFRCGPREAEDSDFYTTLDQAIANKNIAPFETVRGCGCF